VGRRNRILIMENRIEINGVWYVREESAAEENLDITEFQGCVYETDKYCWEATRILKYDDKYYDDIDIKFTDKRTKPWFSMHWDNNFWFKSLLNDDREDAEANSSMCKEGVADFKRFLRALQDKGWLFN